MILRYHRPLTHAGAIFAGVMIALLVRSHPSGPANIRGAGVSRMASAGKDSPGTTSVAADMRSSVRKFRPDFAAAWAALSRLSAADKELLRRRVLREWIGENPDAALEAVLGLDEASALMECFDPLFEKEPEWFLSVLQSHRHGLRGVTVRNWWAERMAARDPSRLVELARDFGPLDSAYLMERAVSGATSDQEKMNAVFAALQAMKAGPETTRLWKAAGMGLSGLGVDALEGRYLESAAPEVTALFGQALAKSLADPELPPDRRREILARVPKDRRTSLALDMAAQAKRNSSAIAAAIDSVISTPDWAPNAKNLAVKLHNSFAGTADAERLAEWAATIPQRDDTEDLYRTAVRSYLSQQAAQEARQWMTSMSSGWRRDNTLAAWVQLKANLRNFDEARWGLGLIESAHFRSEGEKWIANAMENAK